LQTSCSVQQVAIGREKAIYPFHPTSVYELNRPNTVYAATKNYSYSCPTITVLDGLREAVVL